MTRLLLKAELFLVKNCTQLKAELYLKSGTGTRIHIISINAAAEKLGPNMCKALLGIHAFSGCDTVSAFAGRGKIRILNAVKKSVRFQELFGELGTSWDVSTNVMIGLEDLTCQVLSTVCQ
jgi:hypothetical protein